METAVFLVSAAIVLVGALGVLAFRNPVHVALTLVGTLFGVAVLFVAQEAHLLAAVQVIVYAGAIPYFADRQFVDLLAKNDKRVARIPMRQMFFHEVSRALRTAAPIIICQSLRAIRPATETGRVTRAITSTTPTT